LATQLRIIAGDEDFAHEGQGSYASIVEIDTTTRNFIVIRDKVNIYPGRAVILGTSGTLNGTDCYIMAVKTRDFSLQYFRMSDGVLLHKSPDVGLMGMYDSIQADENDESHILVQGFTPQSGEGSFFVDISSGKFTEIPNRGLDFGLYTYISPPLIFSVNWYLSAVFYYNYVNFNNNDIPDILELNCCGTGIDVWTNKREYYVLTPYSLYRCPTVKQSVCTEFMKMSVNLTGQYEHKVLRGITFDKAMRKMYFIADPQTLYTVDVATQTIESQMNLSELFAKYPQVTNLRVYEQ